MRDLSKHDFLAVWLMSTISILQHAKPNLAEKLKNFRKQIYIQNGPNRSKDIPIAQYKL